MLIKVLRDLLQQVINNIDAGNSNLTEEELAEAIQAL